jgi:hypothetical protein
MNLKSTIMILKSASKHRKHRKHRRSVHRFKKQTQKFHFCDSASENCNDASKKSIFLAFFEDDQSFENLKDLILKINKHAELKDYAIVMNRIKKFKLNVRRKT